MKPLVTVPMLQMLICVTVFALATSFRIPIARPYKYTELFSTRGALSPSATENDLAYEYWMDMNDMIPPTAPAFLTKEGCIKKFQNLVEATGNINGALAMLKNDPGVLRFREETVVESYAAWKRKFDGDESKTLELCIRAPMILALKAKVVDATKESDVAQTIFFSYFAVAFRGPTKLLQMLIKPLVK
jgi:hypothetical protein